ncbi:MAG: hypothetical protein RIC03_12230 [Cyclobacteriaceae bacterium]
MKKHFLPIVIIGLILISTSVCPAQVRVTAESGAAINGYNDVRYANVAGNMGSFFSLTGDFQNQEVVPYIRLEVKWQFLERNTIEATAAPLAFEYSGIKKPVAFGDLTYSGEGVQARYEFNTYRLSYRYLVADGTKWQIGLGGTVLMRDARIALTQGAQEEETTDLGFVPLLSFDIRYEATNTLHLLLKGDALVGPQGRAEDIFVGINHEVWAPGFRYRLGYRIIEGGADVAQVYNFSLIHFAALGVSYQFQGW